MAQKLAHVTWRLLAFSAWLASPQGAAAEDGWPAQVRSIRYPSTADGTLQPAMFFAPESSNPVPLLVGLHTWSSDYRQTSTTHGGPYAEWCIRKGWAFIHPDFRGPNRRPEACGSELAVEDIVSAVRYVQGRTRIDEERIYLLGVSGGGHAALLLAGRRPHLWAGVSAWVPISDLTAWRRECKAAGRRYWREIEAVCGGPPGSTAAVDLEYRRRSPLTWLRAPAGTPLDINAGIRDGHEGSVAVSHSLRAFNAVADSRDRIAGADIGHLVEQAEVPAHLRKAAADPSYGDKPPLLRLESGNARVTIFLGGHEIVPGAALGWLEKQRRIRERVGGRAPLVGTRKQLLVDDRLISDKRGIRRVLGTVKKHGVVLHPSLPADFIPPAGQRGSQGYDRDLQGGKKPDGSGVALDFGYYLTVLWNDRVEKFQMWYMAWRLAGVGYAESKDGIHWTRPFVGPTGKDNIVHRGQGFSCMIDPTVEWGAPDKYKAASDLGEDGFGGESTRVGLSYSADGVRWRHYNDSRPVSHRAADTHNQILWDPLRAVYRLQTRTDLGAGGGAGESRSTRIMEHSGGNDLLRNPAAWKTAADRIVIDDPRRETVAWSSKVPRLQLNGMTCWIHEGVYFALFDVYSMDRYEFFSGYDYRTRHEKDVMDFYIGSSRDGRDFDRGWIHAHQPFVPRGPAGSFDKDGVKPPSTIVTRGDEHWIYYGGMSERHYSRGRHLEIGLAKLPRDRLIGLAAGDEPGVITTRPFRLEGAKLEINVEAQSGEIAVEVLDIDGGVRPGFSHREGGSGAGIDDLRWRPRWQGGADLSALLGETVRFRLRLTRATVYAFQLR